MGMDTAPKSLKFRLYLLLLVNPSYRSRPVASRAFTTDDTLHLMDGFQKLLHPSVPLSVVVEMSATSSVPHTFIVTLGHYNHLESVLLVIVG